MSNNEVQESSTETKNLRLQRFLWFWLVYCDSGTFHLSDLRTVRLLGLLVRTDYVGFTKFTTAFSNNFNVKMWYDVVAEYRSVKWICRLMCSTVLLTIIIGARIRMYGAGSKIEAYYIIFTMYASFNSMTLFSRECKRGIACKHAALWCRIFMPCIQRKPRPV